MIPTHIQIWAPVLSSDTGSKEFNPQASSACWLWAPFLETPQESQEVGERMDTYVKHWDIWLQSSKLEVNKNLESDLFLQILIMKNKIG